MPPRSKQSRAEWYTCEVCGCSLSVRDQEKHNNECSLSSFHQYTHGFVLDGHFFGCVTKHSESTTEIVSRHSQEEILAMHPSTMQKAGMFLGENVVLNSAIVLKVWPNGSLPLTTVSVSQSVIDCAHVPTKENVPVTRIPTPCKCAKEIHIELSGFIAALDATFEKYLLKVYGDKFVYPGEVLNLRYYGRPCSLKIQHIKGYDGQTSTDIADSLPTSMRDLRLDDKFTQNIQKAADKFYKITKDTNFVQSSGSCQKEKHSNSPTLADVGGLKSQQVTLQEIANVSLKDGNEKKKYLQVPKGLLLYGPSGVGKTLLIQAVARDMNVPLITVHGTEIWSKFYGESEGKLKSYFVEAMERAPCILLLEELDSLCPKRESSHNEVEKRVVTSLLSLMDDLVGSDKAVIVLGTTSRRDDVDSALRRPGRFHKEIEIGVPTAAERNEILNCILGKIDNSLTSEQVNSIAMKAHGFVGADLNAVCKEACLRKLTSSHDQCIRLTFEDVLQALKSIKPSAMREVALEIPQVTWEDIGGQEDLKHKLKQGIEWPLKYPEAFTRMGARPPKGLLMYGPPGCSKTMIAKALARESGINFIAIKGPELFSKWVGESERAVRELFRKARAAAPAIVFFDEIDALAGERGSHGGGGGDVSDRVLAQLLTEMDGVEALQDVFVLAATNRPDRMDKALLRPGRLDRIVYVPLPDAKTRRQIFTIHMKKSPAVGVDVEDLVQKTDGYSGAEIAAVCQEAALSALQEDINITSIGPRHFEDALSTVKPRTSPDLVAFYESYHERTGLRKL